MADQAVYDLIVLGAGPGGYVCAVRAAKRGLRVAIVERDRVGGVCLNRGCIPTKVLLEAAALARLSRGAAELGVELGPAQVDWARLMQRKAAVVKWLVSGVEGLLVRHKVELLRGQGRLAQDGIVAVEGEGGRRTVRGTVRVVATGSRERSLPGIQPDGKNILTSDDVLELEQLPRSIGIIGAGAVGVEFASLFVDLGLEVTLVEALPQILPLEDAECAQAVREALEKRGVRVLVQAPVQAVEVTGSGCRVTCRQGTQDVVFSAEKVLVAVGRRPNTEGIGLEELGVRMERGYVLVDEDMRTSRPDIFAIGDCVPTLALAHVASAEGKYVADLVSGARPRRLRHEAMPRAVYSEPELAAVGLTEAQAQERGLEVMVARFPLRNNGRAAIHGRLEGLVKVVAERRTGTVLGVHMAGYGAPELIAEGSLAIQLQATVREFGEAVRAHPTVSESVMEAAEAALGMAIHA